MIARNRSELAALQAAGRVVREVIAEMRSATRPGVTLLELDELGARRLKELGALSAPRHFYNFPGATCISVNEEAAHGIPDEYVVRDGDVINIDVSAVLDGYVGDTGESFVVGDAASDAQRICECVKRAVTEALSEIRDGVNLNVIGRRVQEVADDAGFHIVRNLGSHGVGRSLHESPSYVPFDNPNEQRTLTEGMAFTIEPFFTTSTEPWVQQRSDGWTLAVPEGELVAQFEHTVVVQRSGVLVTTA